VSRVAASPLLHRCLLVHAAAHKRVCCCHTTHAAPPPPHSRASSWPCLWASARP
jgi:hypothetical protein